MRLITFASGERASIGAPTERGVVDLGGLVPSGSQQDMLTALIDGFGELCETIAELTIDGAALPWDSVLVGPSVPAPGKVLCVMRNRPALADVSHPFAYLKCAVGAVGSGQTLRLPVGETELWYEPELAVVVRGPARNVPRSQWRTAVFGYTAFLDVVRPSSIFTAGSGAEDWWKSWDTSWAIGPAITVADTGPEPVQGLRMRVRHGDEVIEVADPAGPTLPELVEFLSSVMTLHTGDVIACGAHVSAVTAAVAGSDVELSIPSIGTLAVEVRA